MTSQPGQPGQPGMQQGQPGMQSQPGQPGATQPGNFPSPGQCPSEMQSCPDQFNSANSICMPKRKFDSATQQMKEATCADFQAPQHPSMGGEQGGFGPSSMPSFFNNMPGFGPQRGPGMGQGGPGFGQGSGQQGFGPQQGRPSFFDGPMQGEEMEQDSMDPCEFNPNDPFCQAGFDFGNMKQDFMFDESQFDPSQFRRTNVKQDLREIRNEVRGIKRDAQDVRRQLKEIGRESSGFACPSAVEVDAIATELERFVAAAEALTDTSTAEEAARVKAVLEHVRGTFDPETGIHTPGLRGQLYGSQDPETGEPVPGKIQSLNVCREITGVIFRACETYRNVSKEYERVKKRNVPEAIRSSFETVVPKLKQRCEQPLAALSEKGVSFDDLAKPWMPDSEVCGGGFFDGRMPFPMGGPSFGGPGGGSFGGPGGGQFGGPGMPQFGGPGMPQFGEGFSPEMMEKMKQKFEQFGQGGFNPFGAAVLMLPDEEDFGGFEGENFGRPEFVGPPVIADECKPPVERYLGIDDLMRELDQARIEGEKHFESLNACQMFEMGKQSLESGDRFGPPPEVRGLLQQGLTACEAGDNDLVEKIKAKMLRFKGKPGSKNGVGDLVDIDQMIEEKLKEKLKEKFGDTEDQDNDLLSRLEAKIADLQNKLNDAQKTIFALNEKLSEMATKVASAVELSDKGSSAIGHLAEIKDETVSNQIADAISALADKADAIKDVVSEDAADLIDDTLNVLIQSPPSSAVLSNIQNGLTTIQSYASSGASEDEVLVKVQDELATIAVVNAADVSNKVKSKICASSDTCDLSQWYAVPALEAKNEGFIAAELTEIKPAEAETKCAAVTRAARLLERTGELEIDENNKAPIAGAPEWCRPFIHALKAEGVPFVENLTNPNAPASRLEVAVLLDQTLGDVLPSPENPGEFLTPDTRNLPAEQRDAVAFVRSLGIMDATDGTNFSPTVTFNRAQNATVTIRAFEALESADVVTGE